MQVVEQYNALRGKQLRPRRWSSADLSEGAQLQAIRKGARLVVATPGRLEDYLDRRLFNFQRAADPGARRSRSHAGHGIPSGHSTHRVDSAQRAPDDVLLRHAWKRHGRASVKDYMRNPVRLAFGSTSEAIGKRPRAGF